MRPTPPLVLLLPLALALGACGTDVSGPSAGLFSCILGEAVSLLPGEVVQVSGNANRGVCLDGGDEGANFLYVPFNGTAAPEATLRLRLTGSGLATPPATTLSPADAPVALLGVAPAPQRAQFDPLHERLRAMERGELGARLRAPGSPADPKPRWWSAEAVPLVGDELDFNVGISCTTEAVRTGRVAYVSQRAILVEDVGNPQPLPPEQYESFGLAFDTLIHPVAVAHFGEPTDIDGNGRAIVFFTRAVNALSGPNADTYTAGFFWSGDLFPEEDTPRAEACPAGNQAEMFYMLAPDPTGVAGPPFSTAFVVASTVPVLAHEYQHLINAGRRLWVNEASEFEEPWLNEGLSHAAEELVFYAATGLTAGQNLDRDDLEGVPDGVAAFNQFMAGNFTNYARYLQRPDTASLMGVDDLSTRGATWSFLRYAADRRGPTDAAFFRTLVNARNAGVDNLRAALGADPLSWMQDWTVAVYADDVVPTAARYTQPSWNFRALYEGSTVGGFPLSVLRLAPGEVAALTLHPGGASYPVFRVEGGEGVLHVEGDASIPGALRGSFLRIP